MKPIFIYLFVLLSMGFVVQATGVEPAWNRFVEKKKFFENKGFKFEINKLPDFLYEKPSSEFVVEIPRAFTHMKLKNTFSHVLLLNDDIGVDVLTHTYKGKYRIIVTLSKELAQKSKLYFYYNNGTQGVTEGTQFVIDMAEVVKGK